ncbi:hypothetical protein F4775DRAFT_596730 [Biscogniauxia sp. FL1348]|nr:hypothetical protein F4775DRAFT_596730 [Biscogniauxia sp. FL1348]
MAQETNPPKAPPFFLGFLNFEALVPVSLYDSLSGALLTKNQPTVTSSEASDSPQPQRRTAHTSSNGNDSNSSNGNNKHTGHIRLPGTAKLTPDVQLLQKVLTNNMLNAAAEASARRDGQADADAGSSSSAQLLGDGARIIAEHTTYLETATDHMNVSIREISWIVKRVEGYYMTVIDQVNANYRDRARDCLAKEADLKARLERQDAKIVWLKRGIAGLLIAVTYALGMALSGN